MNDKQLTAMELNVKYGEQHPRYILEEWQDVVCDGDTTLGYWDWVKSEINERPNKYVITIDFETVALLDKSKAMQLISDMVMENSVFTGVFKIAIND